MPFPGIESAVERIRQAVKGRDPICVWGDFDVDGQTSTALLVETLQHLGANVSYYIPIRGVEGHGIHIDSLRRIVEKGAKLVVTCDTGISAHAEVNYAKSHGVDFVITDHHDLGERLPDAVTVINPRLLPDGHPLENLAGVGVAYKLAEALLATEQSSPDALLDLVALGLIADVAVLREETRALAQKGIRALRATKRLGILSIAQLSKTVLSALTEDSIGFALAPRLNALGRLGDANAAVELLLTRDPVRARLLAAQIEGLNTQRRLLTNQVYEAAEEQLRADPALLSRPILLLMHPSWPGGVVGIVAARLVERYRKPALLLTGSDAGTLRGSARSIDGLDITQAIAANAGYVLEFGGHPMAAGLALLSEKLPEFRRALEKTVEKMLGEASVEEETLQIAQWLKLDKLSVGLAEQLEQLAPFGAGNLPPTFATRAVSLKSSREIGRTKEHRKLLIADEDGTAQSILWWNGAGEDLPQGKFDLAYSFRVSSFRGEPGITVEYQDLRPVEEAPIRMAAPTLEIQDLRLGSRKTALPSSCLIWAEGEDKTRGLDRFHLYRSDDLAIWTPPPSGAELRRALAVVQPRRVFLFARPAPLRGADKVLTTLAGMAKFAINQRSGRFSIAEVAAMLAHRELTIRIGLQWLAAGGHLIIKGDDDDVRVERADSAADQLLQHELHSGFASLIEETAAYRAFFGTANPRILLHA